MGFYPEPVQYHLHFPEDDALHGLEVLMASLSVREYNEMMRRAAIQGITEETVKANDEMVDLFVAKLVSWNLEDRDGKAVPRTRKAVDGLDRNLVGKIILAWQMALVGIPVPLESESSNGQLSREQSLGLASASRSLEN